MSVIYLGLGSNLGDRESNLAKALDLLSQKVKLEKISSIYETEPVGYSDQPWFLNLVCAGVTGLEPDDLLFCVKEIEGKLGRVSSFPNAPRPVDIDILFYDRLIIKTERLIIPHPRIEERAFVMIPLSEIAPKFVHPSRGKTIQELLSEMVDLHKVRRWRDVPLVRSAAL